MRQVEPMGTATIVVVEMWAAVGHQGFSQMGSLVTSTQSQSVVQNRQPFKWNTQFLRVSSHIRFRRPPHDRPERGSNRHEGCMMSHAPRREAPPKARSATMRTSSIRRLLRDAWRQERSMDPEQHSTIDLITSRKMTQEIDRIAARLSAAHAITLRDEYHMGGTR